jgi:hypothetical protein
VKAAMGAPDGSFIARASDVNRRKPTCPFEIPD